MIQVGHNVSIPRIFICGFWLCYLTRIISDTASWILIPRAVYVCMQEVHKQPFRYTCSNILVTSDNIIDKEQRYGCYNSTEWTLKHKIDKTRYPREANVENVTKWNRINPCACYVQKIAKVDSWSFPLWPDEAMVPFGAHYAINNLRKWFFWGRHFSVELCQPFFFYFFLIFFFWGGEGATISHIDWSLPN